VTSFWSAVRSAVRPADIVALAVVPAVLLLVGTLPPGIRESLVFEYADPTLLTAYTASYVHFGPGHLLVNIFGYFLVVPMAYLLSVLSGHRDRFFVTFGTFLIAFPFALSGLNWWVLRPAAGLGFSGVLLAFVGYLPMGIADFVEEQFDVGPATSLAPVLFFVTFSLISLLSIRSVVAYRARVIVGTSGLAVATLLMALLYLVSLVDEGENLWDHIRAAPGQPGYFELTVVALFLFVALLVAAFPAEPGSTRGVMNFYAHLLGYALGFIVTYTSVCTAKWLPGNDAL
jgi:hypothetical protein